MKKLISRELMLTYEKIKNTIGKDPYVRVEEIYKSGTRYYVDLICSKYDKAIGLSCLMKNKIKVKEEYILVRVFFKDKETVVRCKGDYNKINHIRLALMLIQLALKSNPYFCNVKMLSKDEDQSVGNLIVEIKPSVVKVDKSDYDYNNITAKNAFEDILKPCIFKHVNIIYTDKVID